VRKLLFYLFIIKKTFLLFVYPLFESKGEFSAAVRKNIENYLIFQPSKLRAKRIKRGLLKKIHPQRFINAEGIKLYGWFIKPKNDMPVILHLHGQAESILSHQDIALFCLEKGYGLFMLSYRGHYKSSGSASEQGVYNDAKASMLQLKRLGADKEIILWGHSLGTVVAVETALQNNVAGIILQSPIKEIKSAAMDINNFYCHRLKFNILGPFVNKYIQRMDFLQKMDNMNKIKDVKCPILILHSKSDRIAPCQNSIDLAKQNKNAELFITDSGSHWDTDWCIERVSDFLKGGLTPKIT